MTDDTSNSRIAGFLAINTLLLVGMIIVLALMLAHVINSVLAAILLIIVVLAMGANLGMWWSRIRGMRRKAGS